MVCRTGASTEKRSSVKVPIVSYEDIKPDIQRIYNGDFSPILCAQPISEMWCSSGTSNGQLKFFPGSDEELHRRKTLTTLVMPFLKKCILQEREKGKALTFLMTRDTIVTPGGLLAPTITSSFFRNPRIYSDKPYPDNRNTSPMEAIHCSDHFQSIYTQLLCGFLQRDDVTRVVALFGSTFVWVMDFLKRHYSDLCRDIVSGELSAKITDPSLRSRMNETFMGRPQPELAKFVEHVCSEEDWEGIITKIWPNTKYMQMTITGSMAQYIPMLKYYSGGSLPLLSLTYGSTECDLGYNLNPTCDPYDVSYTIMPSMAYYEFLPVEFSDFVASKLQHRTVDLANVEVGKEYELVVTTYNGLYRYRVGDVLSPTKFYNSSPQFKFVRRTNVLLNIDIAKTTETELQNAIESASLMLQPYDTKVVDYTSYANVNDSPGHYIIYVELTSTITKASENWPGPDVLEECCLAMEDALCFYYKSCRAGQSIGPLEIRVVSNGTFEKLRDYAISKGATFVQYKVPRCVNLLPMLELLDSCVVSSHFSPSLPRRSS